MQLITKIIIGKLQMIPIKNFNVKMWNGEIFETKSLSQSYCYLSLLRENKDIYNNYIKTWRRTRGTRCTISYTHFIDLYNEIKNKGWNFDSKNDIQLDKRFSRLLIRDGQHRCAILMHIYSEELNMKKTKTGFCPVL